MENSFIKRELYAEDSTTLYSRDREQGSLLIKGVFPEQLILKKFMPYFPKLFKGKIIRCEESFYKLRMKVNSKK